jgi:hypothetical protein
MRLVLEMDFRLLELAKPLHKTSLVRIDQDVADRRVLQERLDRAVSPHFVDDFVRENIELFLIEGQSRVTRIISHVGPDLPGEFFRRQFVERRQVEFVNDQRMQLQSFVE